MASIPIWAWRSTTERAEDSRTGGGRRSLASIANHVFVIALAVAGLGAAGIRAQEAESPVAGEAVHEHRMHRAADAGQGAEPAAATEVIDVFENLVVEFELVGEDGETVTEADFAGRPLLITFGFTNCPHICPTIAAAMGQALRLADSDAAGIFISVDSERDTPVITQAYAANFGPSMTGLSGSYAQIVEAATNFGVTFAVTKTQAAYNVQHTASIFVVDRDGRISDVQPMNARPTELAAAIAD